MKLRKYVEYFILGIVVVHVINVAVQMFKLAPSIEREHELLLETPEHVILSGRILGYFELSQEERQLLDGKYLSNDYSIPAGCCVRVEDSYFARLLLDTQALATVTFAFDCGGVASTQKCSENKLAEKIREILDAPSPHYLYGKYRNSWRFYQGGLRIPETEKFGGFKIIDIVRMEEPLRDEVLVGPMPAKATSVTIALMYGGEFTNPSFTFSR